MQDAKENKETIVKFIKNQFQLEYSRYNYIFKDMDEYEENDYRIINEGIKNNQNGTLQDIEKALIFLMRRLKKYYGKDVVLFIDEYDTPFIEAKTG